MNLIDYNFNEIPEELKIKPQWVLWKSEKKPNNKLTKIPIQYDGKPARTSDRNTWSTFHTAKKFYEESDADGIGFVFSKQDNFIGIDIDKCVTYSESDITRSNPIISDLAKELLERFDSYSEYSVSGNGLHIIIKSPVPEKLITGGKKNSKLNLEIYAYGRYFTITGNKENENDIYEREDELIAVLDEFFPVEDEEVLPAKLNEYQIDRIKLTNYQLWQKMFNAVNGSDIKSLYDGNLINDDHSYSDLALCNHLAFWTGNSATRMESMFRESGLMRDKWDSKRGEFLYSELTIAKAISTTSSTVLDYKSIDDSEFKFNFNKVIPEKDLENILNQRHWDEINKLQEDWMRYGEKGRKPIALSPKHAADILQEYIKFILFDLEENTRLSMYVASQGIYTSNTAYIKRVISWLEPQFNDSKANDVIYHLTNDAEIKPRTKNRYLIPVQNGVFNLKTKELEPFNNDYVFTSKIATQYSTDSTNKVIDGWDIESWLNSIACNNEEIINLLWQVINESLNGNYTRKKSIFLLGEGNNGKGTFQDLLINLIGPQNIASLRVNEFDERFKLALLEGKTLVIGDDVQAGVNIDDSANFNSVVTGDRVSVEQKNKPMYSTVFTCGVIQSTNGMPTFKNKTSGTTRRLIIVPFDADFNGENENFDIKEVYIKDKEVLEYVLYKAINMDFERFDVPEISNQKMEEFKIENDHVLDFKLQSYDNLEINEIPMPLIYSLYKDFCRENEYTALNNRMFFKEFKKKFNGDLEQKMKRFSSKEIHEFSKITYINDIESWNKKPVKYFKNAVYQLIGKKV